MKVATITLNPAIDQTVFINNFTVDQVNRGRAMQHDAGGKGVNVASFLADYGLSVTATGLLGEENAAIFERHFAAKGIQDRFVRVPGATRIGVKIVDEARQQTTDINMPGQEPPVRALETLLSELDNLAADHDWFVLAGNLPPGVSPNLTGQIVTHLRERGRQVALDVSGPALAVGLEAGPTLAKPNIDELRQIGGLDLDGDDALLQATQHLHERGVQYAVISMGSKGALFSNGNDIIHATPPAIAVRSTVGAGDAMVAGMIAGISRGLGLVECARLATAFSLGAISAIGAHLPPHSTLDAYVDQVQINELSIPYGRNL